MSDPRGAETYDGTSIETETHKLPSVENKLQQLEDTTSEKYEAAKLKYRSIQNQIERKALIDHLYELEKLNGETSELSLDIIADVINNGKYKAPAEKKLDLREKAQQGIISSVKSEVDKSLGWAGSIPFIGDFIKESIGGSVQYSLDKRVMNEEDFNKKYEKDSWAGMKSFIGGMMLSFFSWKNSGISDKLIGLGNESYLQNFGKVLGGSVAAVTGVNQVVGEVTAEDTKPIEKKVAEGAAEAANTVAAKATEKKDAAIEKKDELAQKGKDFLTRNEHLVTAENAEVNQLENDAPFLAGTSGLISLSGVEQISNTMTIPIIRSLRYLNFGTLNNLRLDTMNARSNFLNNNPGINHEKEEQALKKILEGLVSNNTSILLKYTFKSNYLKNIIQDPDNSINEQLINSFSNIPRSQDKKHGRSRLEEILKMSNDNTLDWQQDISLEEASILYAFSVPGLFSQSALTGLSSFAGGNAAGEKLSQAPIEVLPMSVIAAVSSLMTGEHGGSSSLEQTNDNKFERDVKEKLKTPKEKRHVEKLIRFKNIIIKSLTKDKRFLLNTDEKSKNLFENNLNYSGVIALYEIMGGRHDLNNINPINLPAIAIAISSIISTAGLDQKGASNRFEGVSYLSSWFTSVLTDSNNNIFTEEEHEVLSIYKDKFMNVMIFSHVKDIAGILGIPFGALGLDFKGAAIASLLGGATLNIAGTKIAKGSLGKNKIPFLGGMLKKLGWAGMIAGGFFTAAHFLNLDNLTTDSAEKDLEEILENNDIDRLLLFFETQKNSITPYSVNGKTAKLIAYPGDHPIVLYNDSFYAIDTLETSIGITDIRSTEDAGSWIQDNVLSFFKSKDTGQRKINNELIDITKMKMDSSGKELIIGSGDHSLSFNFENDIIPNIGGNEKEKRGALSYISEALYDGEGRVYGDNKDPMKYIPIKDLGNNKQLVFVKIGDMNTEA